MKSVQISLSQLKHISSAPLSGRLAVDLLSQSIPALPNSMGFIQMRALGGAAGVQHKDSAWPHRNATVDVQLYADGAYGQGWVDHWSQAVTPLTCGFRYFNYLVRAKGPDRFI